MGTVAWHGDWSIYSAKNRRLQDRRAFSWLGCDVAALVSFGRRSQSEILLESMGQVAEPISTSINT